MLTTISDDMSEARSLFDGKYVQGKKKSTKCSSKDSNNADCGSSTSDSGPKKASDIDSLASLVNYLRIWIASAELYFRSLQFGENYREQSPSQLLSCADKALYTLKLISLTTKQLKPDFPVDGIDPGDLFEAVELSVRSLYFLFGCFGFTSEQVAVLGYVSEIYDQYPLRQTHFFLLELYCVEIARKMILGEDASSECTCSASKVKDGNPYAPVFTLMSMANRLLVDLRTANNSGASLEYSCTLDEFDQICSLAFQACKTLKMPTMGSYVAVVASRAYSYIWLVNKC
jgi:hypothetical protein